MPDHRRVSDRLSRFRLQIDGHLSTGSLGPLILGDTFDESSPWQSRMLPDGCSAMSVARTESDRIRREIVKKLILRNPLSPGDIVMLTAAVRDLHKCYPGRFITDVRTHCHALWENNVHLTPLRENDPGVEVIDCDYPLINSCDQTPYHCLHGFIDFLNERLRLDIRPTAFKGDIHISDLEKSWYSQVHELTGEDMPFWIVVAGGKYDATIKWWDVKRYQEVIDHFRGRIQFVQVGESGHYHPALEGVVDLRGRTDLRQFVRLVYHSQGVLCGVTAAMHLAAAVEVKGGIPANRPCVVVAGGREPVHWEAYPHHQFIHTIGSLPCCAQGGCWRARTVPLGDGDERDEPDRLCVDVVRGLPHCMDMITSAEVIRRIEQYFDGGVIRYLTPDRAAGTEKGALAPSHHSFADQPAGRRRPPGTARKTILIQQASGCYTRMLDLTGPAHAAYAAKHGLSFWSIRGDVQSGRPPSWNKIVLIRRALGLGFDQVVWLDADTLIVRPRENLSGALPEGPPIGLCRHPLPFGDESSHFNAGVMVIRNTELSRQFFEAVWNAGPVSHSWQEQIRINELNQSYPGAIQQLDDKWNSTAGVNAVPRPVIRAWHGKGRKAIRLMERALVTPWRNNGS